MKKLIFAALLVALVLVGTPVFAQTIPSDSASEFYFVNVHIETIWPTRAGYIVQYRAGMHRLSRVHLPLEWFSSAGAKGEIIGLPRGNSWPYMSVFYRNGEFSHVRLYVHRVPSHQSWGSVSQNSSLDSLFENVETLNLQFK